MVEYSSFVLEEESKPADLNARIFFKAPNKSKAQTVGSSSLANETLSKRKHQSTEKEKKSKKPKSKILLSFNENEEEEQ